MAEITFGSFITRKREELDHTLRGFAKMLDISPVYLSNLEKDRRRDPADEIVDKIAALLTMSREEKTEMLDLLAKAKKKPAVASDLPEYINERDIVRVALRTAKDADATDAEWQEFIEKLQKRIIREPPDDYGGQ